MSITGKQLNQTVVWMKAGLKADCVMGNAIVLAKELCEAADLLGVEESEIISVFQFVE